MTKYIVLVEDKPTTSEVGYSAKWKQLDKTFEANTAEKAARAALDISQGESGTFAAIPESSFPIFDLETETNVKVKAARRTPQRTRTSRAPAPAPPEAE